MPANLSNGKTSGEGSFTSYDFTLSELKIINALGQNIDIDFIYSELNIYEDIFSNVINGDVTLRDSSDIIGVLGMHGNEFLSISFSTPGRKKYQKVFRIFKISNYTLRGTSNAQFKIHFCSEEFLLNQQYYISKSFKEKKLSDVVKIIARNILLIPETKLTDENIEESTLLLNPAKDPLIVPNMKPFEAINWVSSFTLSKNDLSPGFFFYETIDGFKFKSLSSLYSANPKKEVFYSPKNDDVLETTGSRSDKLDEMEFKQIFDILDNINNGAYASELLKLDIINRSTEFESFSVNQSSFATLNPYLPQSYAKNRLGNSLNQASAYVRMFPKFQDNLASQWLLIRAARIALLNNTKLHVDLPGDNILSVGDVVMVNIPKNDGQTNPNNIGVDLIKSGRYLITGLRHQLLDNKYFCHAQLCKDSVNTNLNYIPPFNSGWNLAINS